MSKSYESMSEDEKAIVREKIRKLVDRGKPPIKTMIAETGLSEDEINDILTELVLEVKKNIDDMKPALDAAISALLGSGSEPE